MAGTHAVLVGPSRGNVTLQDGTLVDVNPDVVYLDTPEQTAEVAHLVSLRFEAHGHPDHTPAEPFTYDRPAEMADYVPHPDMAALLGITIPADDTEGA